MRRALFAVLVSIGLGGSGSPLAWSHDVAFTAPQVESILSFGPWPPVTASDPSNRVSGKPEAIALGRRLFFDARLSPSGRVSCSSCHRPERAWTDGRAKAAGIAAGLRNTPSLFNVAQSRWFGWSGAGDSLWAQSIRPLLDRREMGASAAHVRSYLTSHGELAEAYLTVFGRRVGDVDAETALVDAAKALAAYQATIVSGRTTFDRLRDSLATGNAAEAAAYPVAAARGLVVFLGKGRCAQCHAGPAFGGDGFSEIDRRRRVVASRHDGVRVVLSSPYSLIGAFSDDAKREAHWTVSQLQAEAAQLERAGKAGVRMPSLRNVTRTAPYLHDGSAANLTEAIAAHRQARGLAGGEVSDLIRFLETLSDAPP